MPKVHYFVTTGESGQKMYGTCLTIWEGHEVTLGDNNDMPPVPTGRRNIGDKATTNSSANAYYYAAANIQVVYLPKCLVILSIHPYLVAFREYLTQLHRLSKMVPPTSDEITNATTSTETNNNDGGYSSEGGIGIGGIGMVVTSTTSNTSTSSIMKKVLTLHRTIYNQFLQ